MNQYSKRRWNRFPFTNNTRSISIIVKVAFSSQSFKIAGGLKESPHGCCDKVLVRLRMTDASRIVHRIPTVLKEPSCIPTSITLHRLTVSFLHGTLRLLKLAASRIPWAPVHPALALADAIKILRYVEPSLANAPVLIRPCKEPRDFWTSLR